MFNTLSAASIVPIIQGNYYSCSKKKRPRLINNHIDPTFSFYELQTEKLTVNIREELSTKLINRPIICKILFSVMTKWEKKLQLLTHKSCTNRYFAKSVEKNQSSQIPIFNIELNYPEI